MFRDWQKVKEHEDLVIANSVSSFEEALSVFESMCELAKLYGGFPRSNINEGLEDTCFLANALKFKKWQKSSSKEFAKL